MDSSDRSLLDRYLTRRDEAAFGILVGRYLDFVHGVARRVTANDELARDVAQSAFIRLAARAALIPREASLSAWLHRSTRWLALDLVRAEASRKKRELKSTLHLDAMDSPAPEPDWSVLGPVIDELVDLLPAGDRELLLLRYYRNESNAAIAVRFGLTESVARKRASRAVEKLRVLLRKRGIATSGAALSVILPAHASPVAPLALKASILQAAQGVAPLTPSFLQSQLVTVTSSQKTALAGACLLLLAATGYTFAPDPDATAAGALSSAGLPGSPAAGKAEPARARTPRAVPATPEERLARLRVIMAIPFSVRKSAELIAYLDDLPPTLFEETASVLLGLAKSGDDTMALTVTAWARVDRPAALAFTEAQPFNQVVVGMQQAILADWASRDLPAALAWIASSDSYPKIFVVGIFDGISRSAPEQLGAVMRDFPPCMNPWDAFNDLTRKLESDPVLYDRIYSGLSDSQRTTFYSHLAGGWQDKGRAAAVLREHPEIAPLVSVPFLYQCWTMENRAAATADLTHMSPGVVQDQAATGIMTQLSRSDPAATVELMSRYPDSVTDAIRTVLVQTLGNTSRTGALEQAAAITDPAEREAAVIAQLKPWRRKEPAAAAAWLEAHPQPPSVWESLPPLP